MVNYWSFNSHIKDIIGGAHLYNGLNAGLTTDRFGRPLSALNLNQGCYQIPPGNYFQTGQLSITVWIKLQDNSFAPCIVSFSNGNELDTINFSIDQSTWKPYFGIYNGNSNIAYSLALSGIQLNEWTHLALTFDQNFNYLIYVNANLSISDNLNVNLNQALKSTTRIYNYVGRGDDSSNQPNINATIDEFKIFNRALTKQEIQFEMNNNNNY